MRYRHFTDDELACECCGVADMDDGFMRMLGRLRRALGVPLPVTSGYRCPDHNEAVSGSKSRTGPHTTGCAVDIACDGVLAFRIVAKAVEMGFTGVGIKQRGRARFVHLDALNKLDGFVRPIIWTY